MQVKNMRHLDSLRTTLEEIDIIFESDQSWEVKYDMIFGLCKQHLWGNLPGFSYYDPDTSYREDVEAVYYALHEYLEDGENLEKTS